MTTDPRALIAEAKRNLEIRPVCECANAAYRHDSCPACMADAWLDANLAALLDGYAAALDEVERLRAGAQKSDARADSSDAFAGSLHGELAEANATISHLTQLAAERYEEAEEVHALAGDAVQGARPTIAGLRQEIGELKLVIEQQDRDMARLVAGLTEAIGVIDNSSGVDETLVCRLRTLLPSRGAPCTTK